MKQPVFEGVATALVTPFHDGTLDIPTLQKLIDFQIANGVSAIVICGTTGEAATMTQAEQLSAISNAVQHAAGRCKIIAGTGSNSTAHALETSRLAAAIGVDAVLVVTPYYNKCTQSGLISHYTAIADAIPVPVIAYNVPSRTGVNISVETYCTLADHPNINGVKEAAAGISKIARTLDICGDRFYVWSGNDDEAVPALSVGAKGLISVLSNVRPAQTVDMVKSALRGDFARAGRLQVDLMKLIDALFSEVNPIPVKEAMRMIGMDAGLPRLPLTRLTEQKREVLQKLLA